VEQIADDVFSIAGPSVRMPGGVLLPSRSTVIRLANRDLIVYSPIAEMSAIDALGKVAHIVAPNLFHHLFVAPARERWPSAKLWAPAGFAAKQPALRVDGDVRDAAFEGVRVEPIAGASKVNEVVLFHEASKSLVCADFIFNVEKPENLRTRLVLGMMGVAGKPAQSRFWTMMRDDRDAMRASFDRILAWPIERVVPCHGSPVAIDAAGLARLMR
jgi:hypothetical protein